MSIKIVVDSAMNIPGVLLERFSINVVPVSVSIDDKTYREGVDATRAEMVRLISTSRKATTSQPAPGDFVDVYNVLRASELISVHITGKLSGTLQTAQIAAEIAGAERIHPFDSESASMGGGWLAIAAGLAAERGESVSTILELLREIRPQVTALLSMPTIKYLQKGGRVTLAKALVASLLSVKPILAFKDGLLEPAGKARSMAGAVKEMAGQLKDKYRDEPVAVAIMHADDEGMGQQLLDEVKGALKVELHFMHELTASLVVHGGPGTLAVAVIPFKYVRDLTK